MKSEQLQLFAFSLLQRHTAVTAWLKSKQLQVAVCSSENSNSPFYINPLCAASSDELALNVLTLALLNNS